MKPVFVIGGVAIVGVIAAAVVLGMAVPQDLDAIIANEDCGNLLNLTEKDMEGSTTTQQMGIASLSLKCLAGTENPSPAQITEIYQLMQKMRDDPINTYTLRDAYEQTRHIRESP